MVLSIDIFTDDYFVVTMYAFDRQKDGRTDRQKGDSNMLSLYRVRCALIRENDIGNNRFRFSFGMQIYGVFTALHAMQTRSGDEIIFSVGLYVCQTRGL